MESKRATKATGTRISCIATAMKANTHEIPITNFVRRLTHAGLSVSSLCLLRQVSSVSSAAGDWTRSGGGRCFRSSHFGVLSVVWAFIHVTYLVSFQSRILVFIQWAIQDLTFSRGARLITGSAPTDFNFNSEVSQMRRTRETKPEPVNAPH